jgi:hypothetical protein
VHQVGHYPESYTEIAHTGTQFSALYGTGDFINAFARVTTGTN